ncbi:hypothetical protein [Bacillus benzoevorans]|uniref:Uncharacterized protein n=1 Tax=Bacillus benzoevorans TaxID=1456 RepID=A0A7X0HPT9_9BACI|nr:hypothetical protein [Bacillus benzoevorans]MBB6443420.1 hypothetical protein [Bacillus benzoevorans]
MKVLAKTPRDFVLTFNNEEFIGLSENEKHEKIAKALREVIFNQVWWIEIKEYIAF